VDIRLLEPGDLANLNCFLAAGFGTSTDAEFASLDVLRWKYIDTDCSYKALVALDCDKIVGFVGVDLTRLVLGCSSEQVTAGQGIDWLASKSNVAVGVLVYEHSNSFSDVQFVIGGSPTAVALRRRLGWQFPSDVGVYCKELSPIHQWHACAGGPLWKAALRFGRYCIRQISLSCKQPNCGLRLRRVTEFGDEIERVIHACQMGELHTLRTSQRLNHYLRYPSGNVTGWLLEDANQVRGFALLNVSVGERGRVGHVVDCFMDTMQPNLWQSALYALTQQLRTQGADLSLCYASTKWMSDALSGCGYHLQGSLPLATRDPKILLPSGASMYLTQLEADHGFL
jgi:hypothetical protein